MAMRVGVPHADEFTIAEHEALGMWVMETYGEKVEIIPLDDDNDKDITEIAKDFKVDVVLVPSESYRPTKVRQLHSTKKSPKILFLMHEVATRSVTRSLWVPIA